jgi:hypothetical protein
MLSTSILASEVVVLVVASEGGRWAFQTGGRLSSERMNIQQPERRETKNGTHFFYEADKGTIRKNSDKKGQVFKIQC